MRLRLILIHIKINPVRNVVLCLPKVVLIVKYMVQFFMSVKQYIINLADM